MTRCKFGLCSAHRFLAYGGDENKCAHNAKNTGPSIRSIELSARASPAALRLVRATPTPPAAIRFIAERLESFFNVSHLSQIGEFTRPLALCDARIESRNKTFRLDL